jgi:hypothetical protein
VTEPPESMDEPPSDISASEFACIRCSYSLTGATIGGRCPECGMPIDKSLRAEGGPPPSCPTATASMILGILSLAVCGILGPIAIVLYYRAMAEIRDGGFASSSRTMAKAGLIMGIISTALSLGGLVLIAIGGF